MPPDRTRPRCRRARFSTATSGCVNGTSGSRRGRTPAPAVLVWAKTDPDAPRHKQFSVIIVPVDTPGIHLRARHSARWATPAGEHCEIRLENVRVPTDNLFGARGEAFAIAQIRLGPGRIFHCMRWLGQMQRAFELMCERARPGTPTVPCCPRRARSSATSRSPPPTSRPPADDPRRGAASSTPARTPGSRSA